MKLFRFVVSVDGIPVAIRKAKSLEQAKSRYLWVQNWNRIPEMKERVKIEPYPGGTLVRLRTSYRPQIGEENSLPAIAPEPTPQPTLPPVPSSTPTTSLQLNLVAEEYFEETVPDEEPDPTPSDCCLLYAYSLA